MTRLIDADALKGRINTAFFSEIGKIIDDAPTIDAVEVVRCKDCRHWRTSYCVIHDDSWEETDYCSDGERKDKR